MSTEKNKSAFFKREYKKLLNYVNKKINDTAERDSEDIIQDVMLNIFDKSDISLQFEDIAAYVYTSIKNKIYDIFRSGRNKTNDLSFDDNLKDNVDLKLSEVLGDIRYESSIEFEKNEKNEKLYHAIDELDEKQKAVLIATEFESRSFKELSFEWDVPIGTLLARKSRALKIIKSKLTDAFK
ncbi:MAG: sigma-70 family RNA polymerase sigma factor [Spirochaetes bacterium]|nr:sigma-70 family RNA polymerase sigma factor [Spirochaetota bacterium]MCK5266783.1 sigma-70 family RNA polymerase sigma factor [Spirochaetota bacterium]